MRCWKHRKGPDRTNLRERIEWLTFVYAQLRIATSQPRIGGGVARTIGDGTPTAIRWLDGRHLTAIRSAIYKIMCSRTKATTA
jgi:hypothetical protein